MAAKPALHGRDHCPGGADPIPCLGSIISMAVLTVDNFSIPGGGPNDVDFTAINDQFDVSNNFDLTGGGDLQINNIGVYAISFRVVGVTFSGSDDAWMLTTADVTSGSVGLWSPRTSTTEMTGDINYNIDSGAGYGIQASDSYAVGAYAAWGAGSTFPVVVRCQITYYVNGTETAATPDCRLTVIRLGTPDE